MLYILPTLIVNLEYLAIKAIRILKNLQENLLISLISNAGTPVISDPVFLLIKTYIENTIKVKCLHGPDMVYPVQEFVFLEFFKKRKE